MWLGLSASDDKDTKFGLCLWQERVRLALWSESCSALYKQAFARMLSSDSTAIHSERKNCQSRGLTRSMLIFFSLQFFLFLRKERNKTKLFYQQFEPATQRSWPGCAGGLHAGGSANWKDDAQEFLHHALRRWPLPSCPEFGGFYVFLEPGAPASLHLPWGALGSPQGRVFCVCHLQ